MGGGRVTRPNFDMPEADPRNPLTEFYALLQQGVTKSGSFALPGLYAAFAPPEDQKPYAEDMWDYCTLASTPRPGFAELAPPEKLQVLYDHLCVADSGAPAALLLTAVSTRKTTAVQLLPPFLSGEDPLPSLPDSAAALTLQLTYEDMLCVEQAPARLARALAQDAARKAWITHPKVENWLTAALAAAQRAYEEKR